MRFYSRISLWCNESACKQTMLILGIDVPERM